MKIAFLLGCLFCQLFTSAFAQQITWNGSQPSADITPEVQVLEDKDGKLSFDEILFAPYQARFKASTKAVLNFGFTESAYWLHFTINNIYSENSVLEIAHAFLPVTDLYYIDSTGNTTVLHAGYKIPLNDKAIRHHFQVFPLPIGKHDLYVRLVSNSHPLQIKLYKESAFDIKSYRQRLMYGFYIGFMFFVILSNLFFYFSLRNRLYLFYAGIVLVYLSYASAVMDGFILYFIPNIDLMFWYITIPTIGVPLQMIYALVFLDVKKQEPKLYHYIVWLIGYFVLYMVIKFWLPLTTVLAMNTVHALISFLTMGYMGYAMGRKGNRLAYYFALAYFIYFLFVLMEATYIQIGEPPYFADLSHVALATLIEAFLLSFLLSKRFEFEKEETDRQRHETQQQLMEKIQDNERIVREQNTLLEKRVAERTRELNTSLEDLRQTQAQLIQSEKMASLGELTAGIAHEIQNPLNFVNNFSEVSSEMIEELNEELEKGDVQNAKLIAVDIKQNLEKITRHGGRADAIVKGMLEHSHASKREKQLTDINALADEYLRLSYHGIRAKSKNFNAKLETYFDDSLGQVNVVPQDIGRVFLNLFTNAAYALNEKKKQLSDTFDPTISVSTKRLDNAIDITIKDNGIGIPQNILDKIYQPFFTTKPTGEGTGLGLSLSYDIVKAHGGEIKVNSKVDEGTEFIIRLPVH